MDPIVIDCGPKTPEEAVERYVQFKRRETLALNLETAARLIAGAAFRAQRQRRGKLAKPFRRKRFRALGGR